MTPLRAKHPNIIFLLADDLSWGSAGFGPYGENSDMDFVTPTLNSWTEDGIVLSNYYTQESCTPARAALMTGRYPLSIGMQYGAVEATVSWGVNMSETLFPQVLQRSGKYTNYQLGKWNLGHFSPKLLPTARGFDYFLGYQSGSTRYWSKQCPNTYHSSKRDDDDNDDDAENTNNFIDLIYGDGSCYSGYDGSDLHKYSTYLYRDKAVKIINKHNYEDKSLFLYVSFQAVHDPFEDNGKYESGVPKTYVGSSIYKKIKKHVDGRKRRQYAMSLYLMDEAIAKIAKAVDKVGQMDNTYFIFTSDNGGCYNAGGRNGPLRGNKGTLFEGGTKVDALVYSTKLSSKQKGKRYGGLMHVTDWFPTMLDMASLSFTAEAGYELDGLSHWDTWSDLSDSDDATVEGPRTSMIYNYYTDVSSISFPTGQPVRAVRNTRYKLIEINSGSDYSEWNDVDTIEDDDANLDELGSCLQSNSWKLGTWGQFLFDLKNDPYETTNLYDDKAHTLIKHELSLLLDAAYENLRPDTKTYIENAQSFKVFQKRGNYIVPWNTNDAEGAPEYSKSCPSTLLSPSDDDDDNDDDNDDDDDDFIDTNPTAEPTTKPSHSPSSKTTLTTTAEPTAKPSTIAMPVKT